jgi:diguanylate cyclase (GGDEF)-like protein
LKSSVRRAGSAFRRPVAELVGFREEEQDELSASLEKLGVTPYWSGKDPQSTKADLRVVRWGIGAQAEFSVKPGLPVLLVADLGKEFHFPLRQSWESSIIWFGSWTADTFALARRLASVAHRLLERTPSAMGPKPAMLECDADGKVCHTTVSSAARLGGVPADFLGKNWVSWLSKEKRQLVQYWLRKGISGKGQGVSDCLVRLTNRRWTFWDIWIQPRVGGFAVYLADESERKELGDQLEYALTHDALTGFLNRWELRRRMERHSKSGTGVLLVADLDDFKIYNDTRGHDEGDEILRRVAHGLRDHFGPKAELARLGGDEFAIFLKDWRMARAARSARTLVASMARRRARIGSAAQPSISVALAQSNRGDPPSQVFRAGDAGLQRAKVRGKARLEVVKEIRVNPPSVRGSWTMEVSQALQAGEFELWLQPVRELKNGKVVFHEALFRLWTPSGMAMPESTLPAIERLGMRIYLASLVMHRCIDLLKRDPRLVLSANIGREVLCDADLSHDLVSSFRRARIHPSRMILEVSEEAGLSELRAGKLFAHRLAKHGFPISLDDYGRGSASMAEIMELPICQVKFDPVIWRPAEKDPRARSILEKMVRLFRDLKIVTIAEGITRRQELNLIRTLRIQYAQGFEMGRPRPSQTTLPTNPRGRLKGLGLPATCNAGTIGPMKLRSRFRGSSL